MLCGQREPRESDVDREPGWTVTAVKKKKKKGSFAVAVVGAEKTKGSLLWRL